MKVQIKQVNWAVPEYGKVQVDSAGEALAASESSGDVDEHSLQILSNWRAAHSFPLNTFQATLRRKARSIDHLALVAQRLKRTPSIINKLRRFPKMRLSLMQDIGGCRAVLKDVAQVRALHTAYRASRLKHTLVNEKNYIDDPKASGYRGIHLIYRYHSDRTDKYNGLLLEIQLRSRIQHAWATAVETVGTFLQHSLKSSEGPEPWLEYFALTSSLFSAVENTTQVPGTPSNNELRNEIARRTTELAVIGKLTAYREVLKTLEEEDLGRAHYFLLDLRPSEGRLTVTGYRAGQLAQATDDYLKVERVVAPLRGAEAVLVSADSMEALRRAYPNYFLDTDVFLEELDTAMTGITDHSATEP